MRSFTVIFTAVRKLQAKGLLEISSDSLIVDFHKGVHLIFYDVEDPVVVVAG